MTARAENAPVRPRRRTVVNSPSVSAYRSPALAAMARRRSVSKVGSKAPDDRELLSLLHSVVTVADHEALRPWRLLTLRGDDRLRLGEALDAAAGTSRADGETNPKPLRAELLIAVVAAQIDHPKVPHWEQVATAAGAAHLLSLALSEAGWGVMWRSGVHTNAEPVRAVHGVGDDELLMGWLYVGDVDPSFARRSAVSSRPVPDPAVFLGAMPR
ncbi:NAD(P)H nitroreductase [Brevibacterium yomogidense]